MDLRAAGSVIRSTRGASRLALALAAAVVCGPAWAQGGAAAAAPQAAADNADAGRKLYVSSCQRCHGINLVTSGLGFDLRQFPAAEKARFVQSVTQGLRAMPAWGGSLKPEQVELLWSYIGSVNGWALAPGAK